MTTGSLIRTATLATLLAASGLVPTAAMAADAHVPVIQVAASEATSRFIPLGIGKSVAIDLPADIKDVLVADPTVANAVVRTARRVYMIGVKVGQTNIFFFDAQGRQIAGFDIAVTRDLNGVRAAFKQAMPDADIRIEGVGEKSVMLTGTATSPAEAQQAFEIAAKLVGSPESVVNGVVVRGRDHEYGFVAVHTNGLFHQHMLACLCRANRPVQMHRVGSRDVDDIHILICE